MPIAPFNGTYPAPDTTAPTAPGPPVITNALANETVTVTVTVSTDNVAVAGYAAFLDGSVNEAGRSANTSINLSQVPAGVHSVVVKAYDARRNYSAASVAKVFVMPSPYLTNADKQLKLSSIHNEQVFTFPTIPVSDLTSYSGTTSMLLRSSQSPYFGVQIGIPIAGIDGVTGLNSGIKFLVASTDDPGALNYSNLAGNGSSSAAYTPKVAGTTYNSITAGLAPGWKQGTFANGTLTTKAVTVDPGVGNWNTYWSDVIPIDGSNQHASSGLYPLLIRLFSAANGCLTKFAMTQQTYNADDFHKAVNGFLSLNLKYTGDAVAAPGAITDATAVSLYNPPGVLVRFLSQEPTLSIAIAGDSRFAGGASYETGIDRAMGVSMLLSNLLYTHNIKHAINSSAVAGWNRAKYLALLYAGLMNGLELPSTIVYLGWSVNDAVSAANIAQAKYDLLALNDFCKASNVNLVVVTPMPRNGGFIAGDMALMQSFTNCVKNTRLRYVDAMTLLGNTDGTYKSGYDDGLVISSHMSSLGYAVLAAALFPLV